MFFTMTEKTSDDVAKFVYKGDDADEAITAAEDAWASKKYVKVWVCEEYFGTIFWYNGNLTD